MPLITLVLATVGRTDELDRLFASLAGQTFRDFEIIVVDQNDDQRLVPILAQARQQGLAVRELKHSPPNLAAARNAGIAMARGRWIGFPDDDCWYEAETLASLCHSIAADAQLRGVVGSWVEQEAGRQALPGTLDALSWRAFRGGDASSICLFFRQELIAGMGGFDARLGVGQWFGAGEETDCVLRALDSGARIGRAPAVRIHHACQSGTKLPWRGARARARGTGALYAKHRMSPYVIARGLLSPCLWPLLRLQGLSALARGLAISLGRLEGLLRWGWGKP